MVYNPNHHEFLIIKNLSNLTLIFNFIRFDLNVTVRRGPVCLFRIIGGSLLLV